MKFVISKDVPKSEKINWLESTVIFEDCLAVFNTKYKLKNQVFYNWKEVTNSLDLFKYEQYLGTNKWQ